MRPGIRGYRQRHTTLIRRVAEAIHPAHAPSLLSTMVLPCDLGALSALANRHGIALIEDAACPLAARSLQ